MECNVPMDKVRMSCMALDYSSQPLVIWHFWPISRPSQFCRGLLFTWYQLMLRMRNIQPVLSGDVVGHSKAAEGLVQL